MSDSSSSTPAPSPPPQESPDMPGFRTWRSIYTFVLAGFVVMVALLAIFSRAFQ